jgi:hypothetical protein
MGQTPVTSWQNRGLIKAGYEYMILMRIWNWFTTSAVYYWIFLVIFPSIYKAFTRANIREKIMDFLIALIFAWVITGPHPDLQGFLKNVNGLLVRALFFTFLIYLVIELLRLPPKLYFDKKRLAYKPTYRDIEVKEYNFDQRLRQKIGLAILSKKVPAPNEEMKITDVHPKLVRFAGTQCGTGGHALPFINEGGISWNGAQFLPKVPVIIPIARLDGNRAVVEYKTDFVMENNTHPPHVYNLEINTSYRLEIVLDGRVNSFSEYAEPCTIKFDLIYDGKDIEMKNFSREPGYDL